jgi:hypothetical protein
MTDKDAVFYRCGWCGHPTDKDGAPIHNDYPTAYVIKMEQSGAKTKHVNGKCCVHREKQPTNEMLMDAGLI